MSTLTRFMTTATSILDEQDRNAARKDQPPFFVRTTWLFAELEELAEPGEVQIFTAIKIARHRQNIAGIGRLLELIDANSAALADGRKRHERRLMCVLIREQIAREAGR